MNNAVMFSSNSDEWATPQNLFDELNNEFNFDLDPCATEDNHKTPRYFDRNTNGLSQKWGGCRVFCNPPYSQISEWVAKAYEEGHQPGTVVVLLIPARTDTRYFHDYILNRSEIRYIKGRLKFGNQKNSAPFPSMVVIFRGPKM